MTSTRRPRSMYNALGYEHRTCPQASEPAPSRTSAYPWLVMVLQEPEKQKASESGDHN
eukprot:32792_2